jgi:GTPase SAR1 family protein
VTPPLRDRAADIGVEFKSRALPSGGETVALQIWGIAEQERFRSVSRTYFRNPARFDEAGMWVNGRQPCLSNTAVLRVGNKSDLTDARAVSAAEAQGSTKRYRLD